MSMARYTIPSESYLTLFFELSALRADFLQRIDLIINKWKFLCYQGKVPKYSSLRYLRCFHSNDRSEKEIFWLLSMS